MPFWKEVVNLDGMNTLEMDYKPAIGRPYIFKANDILPKYEYNEFIDNQTVDEIDSEDLTLPNFKLLQ